MSALVIGVTGTGTGVGKTVVAAGLLSSLRAMGQRAAGLKLVATGTACGEPGEDAELLAAAACSTPADCVLESYALPRSPLAAARAERAVIDTEALVRAVRQRATEADVLVLEGSGGILVPLTDEATFADLFRELGARMLIVGSAGLGTINHCVLTVEACRDRGLDLAGVVLSDIEGTDADFVSENAEQITRQCDVAVLGVLPHLDDPRDVAGLGAAVRRHLDCDALVGSHDSGRAGVVAADRRHVWHPFTQASEWLTEEPLVIRSGSGCWLVDEDGRRYLDAIASLWANVHGHAHPALDRALRTQAGRSAHSTFLGQTHEPGARLAEELSAVLPRGLSRVFYSEAGAAAVEVALRIALLAQQRRGEPERTRFLSLGEAYHGDTAGAVSVGRSEPFHRGLEPLLFDAIRVPSPYVAGENASLRGLRATLDEHGNTLAAFIVEPRIQGAAGMLPHSDGWLQQAVQLCRAAGGLIICDEVATGFGRTGDLFASGGAGLQPDIITLGKGLSGGYLPLSASVVTDELYELFGGAYAEHRTLYYGHTFSGNPLACAVARASLSLFSQEHTLERGRRLAAALEGGLAELRRIPEVFDVRGRGVMRGVELRRGDGRPFDPTLRAGRAVTLAARRRGVIVRPLGDVLVINPPLVMRDHEAALLLDVLHDSIVEAVASLRSAVA